LKINGRFRRYVVQDYRASVPKDKAGFSKGVLVSDPDGHDVLLIQR